VDEGELTDLLCRNTARHAVPGAALGVLRDGAVTTAHHRAADIRTGEPVAQQTRFSIGSLIKPMVATVIVRLAEEGQLSLDEPVAAHLPTLRAAGRLGRARDQARLLGNRSGLALRSPRPVDRTAPAAKDRKGIPGMEEARSSQWQRS
jgi:CubicO group peptidase (beta-lactamase class C family)